MVVRVGSEDSAVFLRNDNREKDGLNLTKP